MDMEYFQKSFSEYLLRAKIFLDSEDELKLTYCSLELRKAIELIVWKQFYDIFYEYFSQRGMDWINFSLKLQDQSTAKMYKPLKKHIRDYSSKAENYEIATHLSSTTF